MKTAITTALVALLASACFFRAGPRRDVDYTEVTARAHDTTSGDGGVAAQTAAASPPSSVSTQ